MPEEKNSRQNLQFLHGSFGNLVWRKSTFAKMQRKFCTKERLPSRDCLVILFGSITKSTKMCTSRQIIVDTWDGVLANLQAVHFAMLDWHPASQIGTSLDAFFLFAYFLFTFGMPSANSEFRKQSKDSEHVFPNSEPFRIFKTKSTPGF